ncbi:hypothetical protein D3C80_1680880 [compost metagenome]
MITVLESVAGITAALGVVLMLKHLGHSYAAFARGKAWAMLGALCAIAVWGLGFMVVAGDWFMAWQAKEHPLAVQLGAMLYMVPNTLALIFLMLQRDVR